MLLVATIALPAAAGAAQRTFVSAKNGNDALNCTNTAPCRSFQRAVNVVAAGGEVIPLDSGGYGRFDIYQSVTVSAPPGIYAGITATAGQGDAIHVAAAMPVSVVLRGLSVTTTAMGTGGIYFSAVAGSTTRIESCSIDGGLYGVFALSAGTIVTQSNITRAFSGVESMGSASARARVLVDKVRVTDCNEGIAAFDYSDIAVRDSVIVKNTWGLVASANNADTDPHIIAEGCTISRNGTGVGIGNFPTGHIFVSNSAITDSTTMGIQLLPGAFVDSFGNNTVVDNAGNETFTNTVAQK